MTDANDMITNLHEETFITPPCPVCNKSGEVIPIAYGLPGLEMFRDAEQGKISLGGCKIKNEMPYYYCKRDEVSF